MPNVGFQIGPEPPMSPLAAKLKGLIAGRQQGLETFSQFALGEEAARNQAGRQQQQTMLQHQLGMQEQGAQQDFTRETEKRQHYLTLVDFLNQAPDDYKPQLLDQFKQSPEFMQAHEQWGGGIQLESYTTPTQGAVQAQEEHALRQEKGKLEVEKLQTEQGWSAQDRQDELRLRKLNEEYLGANTARLIAETETQGDLKASQLAQNSRLIIQQAQAQLDNLKQNGVSDAAVDLWLSQPGNKERARGLAKSKPLAGATTATIKDAARLIIWEEMVDALTKTITKYTEQLDKAFGMATGASTGASTSTSLSVKDIRGSAGS